MASNHDPEYLSSPLSPPGLQGSYLSSFTPRRLQSGYIASLDNLANQQERLEQARKILWRDHGEPTAEAEDLWACALHAGRGAVRK
jgi:hypothetical protein